MKSLRRNKKGVSTAGLTELDYSVLNYEELLAVNGAKGSSNPTGPSDSSIEINDSDINNNPPSNEPTSKNPIDNTNNPEIVKEFTDRGYELLSDKKDSTYTDGSRKEYMQSQFEMFSSDPDSFTIIKKEVSFEGITDGKPDYPNNDYYEYTIFGKNGKEYMKAIDVNRDGKIDYVK